ncbi:hypothetical protein MJH54_28195, partial [Salmonella enterica subsp. enterica serovar Montevideo]|nr:hypothetical protein [Salmonella enterica subsp. enterica serovar Montevideo]
TFVSETDTEVIAHLVNWELKQGGTLREAVLRAIPQLRGAYGTMPMSSDVMTIEFLLSPEMVTVEAFTASIAAPATLSCVMVEFLISR